MEILSLGEKIKKLRKAKNMTLKELAGDRITAAQISHIERDKSHTSYELLKYLSDKLGVSVEYLLENKQVQSKKLTDNLILKADVLISTGKLEEAGHTIKEAIELCKKFELDNSFAKSLFLFASMYMILNDANNAIVNFQKALFYYIKTNDNEGVYKSYYSIGVLYMKQKLYDVTLVNLNLAEEVLKKVETDNYKLRKELYSKLALCYLKLDSPEKSLEYIERVNNMDNKYELDEEVEILLVKADNMMRLGNINDSQNILKKALKLIQTDKENEILADVYLSMSDVYGYIGNIEKTIEYSKKSYEIKSKLKNCDTNNEVDKLIDSYIKNKDYFSAKKYCKLILASSIKCKDKASECNILRKYSTICREEGEVNIAIEYLLKSVEIAVMLEDNKSLANIYIDLAKIYSTISREKELDYYEKAVKIYEDLKII